MNTGVAGSSKNTSSTTLSSAVAGPSNAKPFGLPPLPLAVSKEKKPRKKLPSLHITSTPVKDALVNIEVEKKIKEEKKEENRKRRLENQKKKVKKQKKKEIQKGRKQEHVRKIRFDDDNESSDSSVSISYMEEDDDNNYVEDTEDVCLICNDPGKDEVWYACSHCRQWAHAACTGLTATEAKRKAYVCDFCEGP